jgi:hypothetical protein
MFAAPAKSRGLLAAAAAASVPGVRLSAAGDARAADGLARAARAVIAAAGVLGRAGEGVPADTSAAHPAVATRALRFTPRSTASWRPTSRPATPVQARSPLGRVVPTLPGPPSIVATRVDGLVVEAARAGPVSAGATLFVLVPLSRASARRLGPP